MMAATFAIQVSASIDLDATTQLPANSFLAEYCTENNLIFFYVGANSPGEEIGVVIPAVNLPAATNIVGPGAFAPPPVLAALPNPGFGGATSIFGLEEGSLLFAGALATGTVPAGTLLAVAIPPAGFDVSSFSFDTAGQIANTADGWPLVVRARAGEVVTTVTTTAAPPPTTVTTTVTTPLGTGDETTVSGDETTVTTVSGETTPTGTGTTANTTASATTAAGPNPPTGVALVVIPTLVAAGAALVVAKKRK
jgi:hypothetical protein